MSGISRCIALGGTTASERVLDVDMDVDVSDSCGPGCQLGPCTGRLHWEKYYIILFLLVLVNYAKLSMTQKVARILLLTGKSRSLVEF